MGRLYDAFDLHFFMEPCKEAAMQQPIATNDVILFSTLRENQYFDRKSARKDDKEIAKHY